MYLGLGVGKERSALVSPETQGTNSKKRESERIWCERRAAGTCSVINECDEHETVSLLEVVIRPQRENVIRMY
jgi:hypothetical protein